MNESNRNESMQYFSYTAATKSIVALAAFAAASMIGGANLAQQLVTPLVRLLSASSSSKSSASSATTRIRRYKEVGRMIALVVASI